MKSLVAALILLAAVSAGVIMFGPLLNADQHEEISVTAIAALPTFAPVHHAKAAALKVRAP
jgi:hypothetical protein